MSSPQKEYMRPLPGEITLKEYVYSLALAEGVTPNAIYSRIARKKLVPPITRRINSIVMFVKKS